MLSRRQFLARSGALAGAALLPNAAPAFGATNLRKIIDIGPGGVIYPGSAQDYRAYNNRAYFAETQTGWIRLWADWPSLQPDVRYAIEDPANPGYPNLLALDAQIRQACADGLWVMLLPYRHPAWANGTAGLVRNTDAEIAFEYTDRMSKAQWDKYVAKGRNPSVYNPSRRAIEYRVPTEGYRLDGAWSKFFEFLMRRYHWGQRASGRYVGGFELVNEPNLQLFPQRAPATSADPFSATGALKIGATIAQMLKTAQAVSARVGHTTGLYAPSSSDSEVVSRLVTHYTEFTTNLLDACAAIGYRPHAGQGWSHHNYSDVEGRVATRVQLLRDRLRGRWFGKAEPGAPTVWITEGGARVAKMRTLYPGEDPLAAQAKCLQTAWNLHNTSTGGGAGVAMLAQYLLYGDPNFDCGLLEPAPATVKRPAYATWATFPKRK
jgi:hypothetical protein